MAKQEYVIKNRQWLADKSHEEGVMAVGAGVFAKVLKKGPATGAAPNRNSVVTVHYTGCTINGKTFDSSRGSTPPAMRLRDLISGWMVALTQMRPGDRWEIYIPAEQGYGMRSIPGIPGGSTLVFDVELLSFA